MAKDLGLHMDGYFARRRERYVLDYVKSELIKEYGAETVQARRMRVYTTIDLKKQREAREAIADTMGDVGPVVGDRHDRPQERRHRRDGLLGSDVRASRSSTSPPRATASPAPRSRSWR